MENVVLQTNFEGLKLFKRGKVRDIYDLGEYYLMISSDRLSAFDVIMNQGIPHKGEILTQISKFWFDFTTDIIDNHVITMNVDEYPEECNPYKDILKNRSMLVKKAELIPVECIVRGYLSGTGWNDYQKYQSICGIKLPSGLVESERLPEPIFTPSTKAEIGEHDLNITIDKAKDLVGSKIYIILEETALAIYNIAYNYAIEKGIIIADTKMEFGILGNKVILIDELLTPDSSRFWPKENYQKGRAQDSYDKQYVRDYLLSINFNKQPPAPDLPEDVIANTSSKYKDALKQLTGIEI
ncbi:MAG: phosphoribosylaminoimidazolesuccinocarboxamide synthase [Melioribacteraceae bacterium]|nr:phosphoribosylaminoimidazolesuccinocarboxamide synthase [Melioribacteraceae bacterium]